MFGSDGLKQHPDDIRKSITHCDKKLWIETKYIFKPLSIKDSSSIWIHNLINIPYLQKSRIRIGAEPGKRVNCVKIVLEEPDDNSYSIQYIIYNDSNIDNYIFIREEDETRYYYTVNRELEHFIYREIYGGKIIYDNLDILYIGKYMVEK